MIMEKQLYSEAQTAWGGEKQAEGQGGARP